MVRLREMEVDDDELYELYERRVKRELSSHIICMLEGRRQRGVRRHTYTQSTNQIDGWRSKQKLVERRAFHRLETGKHQAPAMTRIAYHAFPYRDPRLIKTD